MGHDANVTLEGRSSLTPLVYAALGGHHLLMQISVDKLAELGCLEDHIDAKGGRYGWTPLHCAAENGHILVISLLLVNGHAATAMLLLKGDMDGLAPVHRLIEDNMS
jgi:ankyrin repeat protein